MEINDKMVKYLKRKLIRYYKTKKNGITLNTRPQKLITLHIAKATGYTYDQTRYRLAWLENNGIIEVFRAWADINDRKNYYRLTAGGRQFLDTL